MGVILELAFVLTALQPQGQGQGPATTPKPLPKPGTTILPNGLVVPAREEPKPVARVRSDFDEPPVHGPAPAKPRPLAGGASSQDPVATPASTPSPTLDLRSALLDVFQRIGHPADLAALGGVSVRVQVHVFEANGAELGMREFVHEADLATRDRDRLRFVAQDKIYGRDGKQVFVQYRNMDWPALEREAREELELHGFLLRAPWLLADPERYTVFPKEPVQRDGRRLIRIRIEERHGEDLVGPRDPALVLDVFELLCAAETLEPHELKLQRKGMPARTVKLLDWREFGSVRLPARRVFLAPDGTRALELVITQLDSRQSLPEALFRPAPR